MNLEVHSASTLISDRLALDSEGAEMVGLFIVYAVNVSCLVNERRSWVDNIELGE